MNDKRGPGRPPSLSPKRQWTIALDAEVADTVDILLMDSLTKKPRHGARGALVSQLLREWIRSQQLLHRSIANETL